MMMILALMLAAATPLPVADAATAAANRAVAERAAEMLRSRYVFPERGARYAAALRARAKRGSYDAIADRAALAARLTADVQSVAPDGHLRFHAAAPVTEPAAPSAAAPTETAQPTTGITAATWIAPGVAYIAFDHFDDRPDAVAALDRFLHDHRAARALIIDSRDNRGGAFDMMGVLANHLFAAPRLLANMDMAAPVVAQFGAPFPIDGQVMRRTAGPKGLVRFQHWAVPTRDGGALFDVPVYYLTSRRTFSAAEHMAMVLKSSGRATLIGETTGGGNHFGGTEPVADGIEVFVPVGHTTDPASGKDWEGVGITPDVAVAAADALDEALRRIEGTRR